MRTLLHVLLLILLCSACKKEEPPAPPPSEPAVTIWTPAFSYTRSGQAYQQTEPAWTFNSGSTLQEYNGEEYHHALQEAVVMNTLDSVEQWRIGFIGTFVTPVGILPTTTALGGMALVDTYFFGRFLWNEADSLYTVNEGVRVEYKDPAGVIWSSDRVPGTNGGNFTVTDVTTTGLTSGTVRQVKITFSCAMRNNGGQSFNVVNASYQGPLVVL